jgi:DNA-directed RNA polymerase specialized sigma subunit
MFKSPPTATVQHARPNVKRRYKRYPPLTKEQQKLVAEHAWIAGRLAHRAKGLTGNTTGSMTREDLESVANFALCVAATRWSPTRGIKYSTYAWSTAHGYIQHALRDHSRMVRTPRWVTNCKNKVDELLKDGKTYLEVAEELGMDEDRVIMCDMASFNYHISYDNQPEDWATKEFVFDVDEAKSALLSPQLVREIKKLTDAEMSMLMRFIGEEETSEEEREWASDKFFELRGVAYGFAEEE